jgi:glycosyltransferase involved in cell wall biosynthesis
MNSSHNPVLTICIPAYGYEEGVRRILKNLQDSSRLEILISEDISKSPIDLSDFSHWQCLTHTVNSAPRGAIANWNKVISEAKGTFVWLLHHDEEPIFPSGIKDFLDFLEHSQTTDLLLSRLEVHDRIWQRVLRSDLSRKIFLRFNYLILLHNSIGAPSNIIVNRESITSFDEELQWFVDVEWYYRLFVNCQKVDFSHFRIVTHPYTQSITQQIKTEIEIIAQREVGIVCKKHNASRGFRFLWRTKLSIFGRIKGFLS